MQRCLHEVKPSEMMKLMSNKDIKAGTYEFFDMTAIQIIKRSGIKTVILKWWGCK